MCTCEYTGRGRVCVFVLYMLPSEYFIARIMTVIFAIYLM
jgi:hypothetical protein